MAILINQGFYIPFSNFPSNSVLEQTVQIIKKKFSITYTDKILKKTFYNKSFIIDYTKKYIILKRFGYYLLFEPVNLKINFKQNPHLSISWIGEQTYNQSIITTHILNNIFNTPEKGNAGCIVKLKPGQGKTYIASYLIAALKCRTIIIHHTSNIFEQTKKAIKSTISGNYTIGEYSGQKKKYGHIIIMTIHSALSPTFTFKDKTISAKNLFEKFDLIIFDECHKYLSDNRLKIFNTHQFKYTLGLSATPFEHPKHFGIISTWVIGPILNCESLPGYQEPKEENQFKGTIFKYNYSSFENYTRRSTYNNTVSFTETVKQMCHDHYRTSLIIQIIKHALQKDHNIILFAEFIPYLKVIYELLKSFGLTNSLITEPIFNPENFEPIILTGGAGIKKMNQAEKSDIILTTYGYMGTGKSIPRLDCCIFATPRRKNTEQYIGRILREGSDKSISRTIYDIVDTKLSLKSQFYDRNKIYTAYANIFKIVQVDVNYSELTPYDYELIFKTEMDEEINEEDENEISNILLPILN